MDPVQLKYFISLQLTPHVGPKTARNLIAYCGSAEAVYNEKFAHLVKIPEIGEYTARAIKNFNDFDRAEDEVEFVEKHHISATHFLSTGYPERLKDLEDAPLVLYYKGTADLNHLRILGIVGTRRATNYGKEICEKIVSELEAYDVITVSGLAFGIDHCTHQSSLKYGIPTVGVLGHGLDRIYPFQHRALADKMVNNGGLLTEFLSETTPNRENFPMRNRIVAGLVDALVVVETAKRGGALITAEIAYSYNRIVFSVPGRIGDTYSEGCNNYIRLQKSYLIHSADDIAYHLGWQKKTGTVQKNNIPSLKNLDADELLIVKTVKSKGKIHIDKLATINHFDTSNLSVLLLNLEFKGFIKALPGSFYKTTF